MTLNATLSQPRVAWMLNIALALIIMLVALPPRLDAARAYDTPIQSEERLYDRYAWPWAIGEGTEPREKAFPWHPLGSFTHRPPLYALFMGVIYRLYGHEFEPVRVAQAWLGALTCVLVLVLGSQVINRWVGLAAALLMANYSFLIGFVPRIMSETLFIFLMMAALVVLLMARSGSLWALFWGSVLVGLANLTRPVLLLPFFPLLLVWLWFIPGFRRRPFHALAALALGTLLTIGPVVVRNYQLQGRLVLISSNSGFTFFHGIARTKGLTNAEALPTKEQVQDLGLGELDEQAEFRRLALAYLRQYPQDIPTIVMFQAEEFWVASQGYKISDVVIPTPEEPTLWPFIGWGAILSLFFFPRRNTHARALLYIVLLAQIFMGLVFHMEVRYRLPMAPVMAVLTFWLAWCALEFIWTMVRQAMAAPNVRPTPQ